ncbi:MAG: aminotransferase class I/II-fold pyridoxal phosphate-dependent enzyme, partial [Gammaproteobacteria bacterium]|nr:aminotransferase class I/II-fold pyridoxal phosphate-dependent enzyme [Gammaproteobacteria bacterium]
LRQAGYIVPDSQSNFVLASVPDNQSAEDIYLALKKKGILVRYFKNEDRLDDKLRITIGTPEDNQRLLDALAAIQS